MSHHRKPSHLPRVKVVAWAGWMLSGDPFLTAQVEGAAGLIVLAAVAVTHLAGRSRRSP